METLRELTNDMYALLEYADSTDPDDQAVFEDTLEGLKGMIEKKADGYCAVMDQIKANIAAHDLEIKRLTARKNAMEANIKRMKELLLEAMVAMDEKKIMTGLYTVTRCKNGGKQPIEITGEVPDNYKRIVYETDLEKIRKELEDGKQLDFAHLEERGEHLRIK